MRARLTLRTFLPALLALASASGCAGSNGDQAGPATAAADPAELPAYSYALAGGDKLRVVVFGNPNLGGDFTIGGSGFISLPLIGEVDVRGLTSTQLQTRIAAKLADGYLKDPRVAIEVLSTRPFYILGEVNRPGEYPFANGLTVVAAIAQAGGYTYRAKTREVLIKHAGDQSEAEYPVTPTTKVAPGDVIRIKERWF